MDDQAPATKGDLTVLKRDFTEMKGDFTELKEDSTTLRREVRIGNIEHRQDAREVRDAIRSLEEHVDNVLKVITSVDSESKEKMSGHERRIARLEKVVF